jgi:penicillin-binding protein 1A
MGYTPVLATGVWVCYPDALQSMSSVHGISVAGGTFPAQIWHDFMSVALGDNCESFPEPENPVEWIPFHGEYSSSSGSSCSSASVSGTGSSEGAYGCSYESSYESTPSDDSDGRNQGAYAPGRGQKPAPKPDGGDDDSDSEPAPPPAPPPPVTPGGGISP